MEVYTAMLTTMPQSPTSSAAVTPQEQWAELADLVLRVAREIRTVEVPDPEAVRLTLSESHVMRHVDRFPGCTPTETAQITGMQRTNVSTTLRALEKKGLVDLHRDEDDHRAVHAYPTALARQNLDLLRGCWSARVGEALGAHEDVTPTLAVLARLEEELVRRRMAGPRGA